MKASDWNVIGPEYSKVNDSRRETVFSFIRDRLRELKPSHLLDYGGGDGKFALGCAELPIERIVTRYHQKVCK